MLKVDDIFLTPQKAIILDNRAIISDIHLGFENVLQNSGISIPEVQLEDVLIQLEEILSIGVEEVIINGDIKHEFSKNLPGEWKDVIKLLEYLSDRVDVCIIRGNHDNFLPTILKKFPEIKFMDTVKAGGYTIIHGHRKLESDENRLIMGHEHPSVKLRGDVGGIYRYPCFLKLDQIFILPAFSPLMKGTDMLTATGFLSPVLGNMKVESAEVYAIEDDVMYLGSISDLRRLGN